MFVRSFKSVDRQNLPIRVLLVNRVSSNIKQKLVQFKPNSKQDLYWLDLNCNLMNLFSVKTLKRSLQCVTFIRKQLHKIPTIHKVIYSVI